MTGDTLQVQNIGVVLQFATCTWFEGVLTIALSANYVQPKVICHLKVTTEQHIHKSNVAHK